MDCFSCRAQYAETGREDSVPCDSENGWGDCPYNKWVCGSPGNPGPDGCGLSPDNVQALDFYHRWKQFGDKTWDLIDIEIEDDMETFMGKLAMIDQYAPQINQSIQQDQKARKELERARNNGNSQVRNRR